MKEKLTLYRPAAAAFLVMMAMAVTSSTLSFFLEPVCAQLGIGKGSFSLIFSLMTVSGALTNPILGRYAGKKGVRGILVVCAVYVIRLAVLELNSENIGGHKQDGTTERTVVVQAVRGQIYDRNGVPLVTNAYTYEVALGL